MGSSCCEDRMRRQGLCFKPDRGLCNNHKIMLQRGRHSSHQKSKEDKWKATGAVSALASGLRGPLNWRGWLWIEQITQTCAVSHITDLQTHSQKLHVRSKTQATAWEPCPQPVDRQHGGNNQGLWRGPSSGEETWRPWSWPTVPVRQKMLELKEIRGLRLGSAAELTTADWWGKFHTSRSRRNPLCSRLWCKS